MSAMDDRANSRGVRLVGPACARARKALGLTQEQFAESSRGPNCISLATIKRAEHGAAIDLSSAQRLAVLLKTDLAFLQQDAAMASGGGAVPAAPQALGRRAAIAVLPFEILTPQASPAAESHYLSDGFVEELLCKLGAWWFPVISRCSTVRYRGTRVDPQAVGAELDARYLVTGSVRQHGAGARISVELSNTETREVIWSGQVDDDQSNFVLLQEAVSNRIAGQIGGGVLDAESTRAYRIASPDKLDAWHLGMRGAWHFRRGMSKDNEQARSYLREALQQDSLLRSAHYFMCMSHQQDLSQHWSTSPGSSLRELLDCSNEFGRLFPQDPYMHTVSAYAHVYTGRRSAALDCLDEALGSGGRNVMVARSLRGQVLAMANRAEEAIQEFVVALQLSPFDPSAHTLKMGLAFANFVLGRYQEMVQWCESALTRAPHWSLGYATLAVGYAYLGDEERARELGQRAQALGGSSAALKVMMSSTDPDIAERFLQGLRLAGLEA